MAVAWVLAAWRVRTLLNTTATRNYLMWLKVGAVPIALGIVTATSKFTTALPWAVVVLAVLFQPRIRTAVTSAVVVGIPLASGVLWTAWADHLKNQSVLSRMESSSATRRHMMRHVSERACFEVWGTIGLRALMFVGIVGLVWLIVGAATMATRPQRLVSGAVLSVPLVAPLIFFGLYEVHDYYQMAIVPALAVALGIGAAATQQKLRGRPVAVVGMLSAHTVGFLFVGGVAFLHAQMPSGFAPKTELAATTTAAEQVIGIGQGWNPQPFFEADRQGYLVGIGPKPDELVQLLDSDLGSARALWTAKPKAPLAADFLKHFPRIAAVGQETYRFGTKASDLESGPVAPIVTWERLEPQSGVLATATTQPPLLSVTCDGVERALPAPRRELSVSVDRQVWLAVGSTSAALPIGSGTVRSVEPVTSVSCSAVDGIVSVVVLR